MTDVSQEQVPVEVAGPSIGLEDLQNAVKVIDYACEQGAFKGWNVIQQVSQVREKINLFLIAAIPKEEPKEEPKKVVKSKKSAVTKAVAKAVAKVVEKPVAKNKAKKVAAKK